MILYLQDLDFTYEIEEDEYGDLAPVLKVYIINGPWAIEESFGLDRLVKEGIEQDKTFTFQDPHSFVPTYILNLTYKGGSEKYREDDFWVEFLYRVSRDPLYAVEPNRIVGRGFAEFVHDMNVQRFPELLKYVKKGGGEG